MALIEETEFILNKYFDEFNFIENNPLFKLDFSKTWIDIKTRKRKDNQKFQMERKAENDKRI